MAVIVYSFCTSTALSEGPRKYKDSRSVYIKLRDKNTNIGSGILMDDVLEKERNR